MNDNIIKADIIKEFSEWKIKSSGITKYPNGEIYEGDVVNNSREGQGKFTGEDFIYEGQWKSNEPNGFGRIVWKDNATMECQWNGWWKPTGIVIRENIYWTYAVE